MCGQQAEDAYHAMMVCRHALALRQALRDHWLLPAEHTLFWTGPDWLLMLVHNNSLEGEVEDQKGKRSLEITGDIGSRKSCPLRGRGRS